MGDFKILILAYLIGHSPIESQQYFQMQGWFNTMDECKEELLKTMPDGRYEVMNEFVIDGIVTTIDLHKRILSHEKFITSEFDTNWLGKEKFY